MEEGTTVKILALACILSHASLARVDRQATHLKVRRQKNYKNTTEYFCQINAGYRRRLNHVNNNRLEESINL